MTQAPSGERQGGSGDGRRALVVGAGLAGCLLATYLARDGWKVLLCERRGDPRKAGAGGGRSINLAISARGLKALRRAGLEETVLAEGVRMPGRMIHPVSGEAFFTPYSADPTRAINSVSRGGLNRLLLEAAEAEPNCEVRFDRRAVEVDFERGAVEFETPEGRERHEAELVVGADGAYSAIRGVMQKIERFDYAQQFLGHGYKELLIPAVAPGTGPHAPFAMDPAALHIWPRGGSMMIALPNRDGSFTCTLFWPWEGPGSFAEIATPAAALAHFKKFYPDAVPLMPTLEADFARNPVGSMVTVRCFPWTRGGKVALLGDAAHAIVPFYGQGANASFEDCEALVDALRAHRDVATALAAYEQARKRNADAIADLALRNFIEMRDLAGRRSFRIRKKVEHLLTKLFPSSFEPLYDRVSFGTRPYVEALATAHRHDRGFRLAAWLAAAVAAVVLVAGAVWIAAAMRHDREAGTAEAAIADASSLALDSDETTR
jgi:kynurenine 3-monooxygenase